MNAGSLRKTLPFILHGPGRLFAMPLLSCIVKLFEALFQFVASRHRFKAVLGIISLQDAKIRHIDHTTIEIEVSL